MKAQKPKRGISVLKGVDLISTFPDHVIQYILSFLPTEEIIRTCVLSKRWRFLWTAVPTLSFCYTRYRNTPHLLEPYINKTLTHYTGSQVEKFLLAINYNAAFQSQVNEWVGFVTARRVEELTLDFTYSTRSHCRGEPYRLPLEIYSSSSLRVLKTVFCEFGPVNGRVSWTALKVLSIGSVALSNEIVAQVLSGSPMLETLRLKDCVGTDKIVLYSSSLKELVIDVWKSWNDKSSERVIVISSPSIRSLSLVGYVDIIYKLMAVSSSSLVEANVGFEMSPIEYDRNFSKTILKEFLQKLRHVSKLTIGTSCLQIISAGKEQCRFPKLKNLTIESMITEEMDLHAITCLLESSPLLEILTIKIMTSCSYRFNPVRLDIKKPKPWTRRGSMCECFANHLKIIKITEYDPSFPGVNLVCSLVEFLLAKAKVLEKMDIGVSNNCFDGYWRKSKMKPKLSDLFDVNRRLSNFPRASPDAVFIIENPFK